MYNNQNINTAINNLLNRQFDIQTIKEHLISKGYKSEEIETALDNVAKTNQGKSKNQVTIKQGFNGFRFIVIGILLLFSSTVLKSYSDNNALNFFRILLGLAAIAYGIFIATRPLRDKP